MVEDKNLDTEQMQNLSIKEFVNWCLEHKEKEPTLLAATQDERDEFRATLGLVPEDIITALNVIEDPYLACEVLLPYWNILVLMGRPPIKHIPDFIHVALTFAWKPKKPEARAMRLEGGINWDSSGSMTDGFLASLLEDRCSQLIGEIAVAGLDKLYEKYSQPVGVKSKIILPGEEDNT